MKKYLILENGTVFEGEAFGAERDTIAEIVFNTAIVGYVDILTDPCYLGQAICQTFPLVGNYGVFALNENENKTYASAFIVREYAKEPSNFRCEKDINTFLKEHDIPGICGIDTRALTKLLRENGTMNGAIVSDPASVTLDEIRNYRTAKPAAAVSTKEAFTVNAGAGRKLAMLDLGCKCEILKALAEKDCEITVLPYNASADEILALNPTGLVVSDGPGDPAELTETIATIRTLAGKLPMMGVGTGHLVLALANDIPVQKLKFGHHGSNQPVRDLVNQQMYITVQNHCYAAAEADSTVAEVLFANLNDNSCEGLQYKKIPAVSVQFHPELSGGPKSMLYLYDMFLALGKN